MQSKHTIESRIKKETKNRGKKIAPKAIKSNVSINVFNAEFNRFIKICYFLSASRILLHTYTHTILAVRTTEDWSPVHFVKKRDVCQCEAADRSRVFLFSVCKHFFFCSLFRANCTLCPVWKNDAKVHWNDKLSLSSTELLCKSYEFKSWTKINLLIKKQRTNRMIRQIVRQRKR